MLKDFLNKMIFSYIKVMKNLKTSIYKTIFVYSHTGGKSHSNIFSLSDVIGLY